MHFYREKFGPYYYYRLTDLNLKKNQKKIFKPTNKTLKIS